MRVIQDGLVTEARDAALESLHALELASTARSLRAALLKHAGQELERAQKCVRGELATLEAREKDGCS